MQEHNKLGFMLKNDQGEVVVQSMFSAHSHRRVVRGSVTCPVPDAPGLYYRLTPLEARQLTAEQHEAIHDRAKAWLKARIDAAADEAAKLIKKMKPEKPPKADPPPEKPTED